MLKNFDDWNEVKKKTDEKNDARLIKAGEIRWCRIGVNIGKESNGKSQYFRRPVLILKKYSGDVFLGLPLTSREKVGNWYFPLMQKEKYGYIILNQGRTLDKKRLENKLIQISEKELAQVKKAYCDLIFSP